VAVLMVRWSRREIIIGTGLLVALLNLVFLFLNDFTLLVIVYFLIYYWSLYK
jgi:predicted MFS family arabinose efflux permease